jgi:hypothetical protein
VYGGGEMVSPALPPNDSGPDRDVGDR